MEIDQVQPTGAQNGYREAFNKLCDVLGAGGLILPDEMVDGLWRESPQSPARDGEFPLCVFVPSSDDETDLNDTLVALVAGVARAFPVMGSRLPHVNLQELEMIGGWRFVPSGEDAARSNTVYWTTVSLSFWRDKTCSGGAHVAISWFEALTFLAVYGKRLPGDLVLRLPLEGLFQDEITGRLEAVILDLCPGPNGPILSFEVYQI
ncbi:MAG: hypothetical protein QG668_596 [Patescibacteria group bacterium]|nr:hypothetical protein [Patescibacteria group bacterium]